MLAAAVYEAGGDQADAHLRAPMLRLSLFGSLQFDAVNLITVLLYGPLSAASHLLEPGSDGSLDPRVAPPLRRADGERAATPRATGIGRWAPTGATRCVKCDSRLNPNNGGQHECHRSGDGLGQLHRLG
jgi:hypothetical protein